MNSFILYDDYDYSASAIVISNKSRDELQEIINSIRYKERADNEDYLMEDVIEELKKHAIVNEINSNGKLFY